MYYARFLIMTFALFLGAGLVLNTLLNVMRGTFNDGSIGNWSLAISVTVVGTGITTLALIFFWIREAIRRGK